VSRSLTIALLAVVIGAALSVMAVLRWGQDRSLTRLQRQGTIRVGYAVEAPFAFVGPGGDVTGESPEVAKHVVAQLGIRRIEWQQVEFGSLIPDLESGRFDVIAAGMFITPERAQRVSFSEPTFHVQQALLVARGNPRQIHSYEQIAGPANGRIAVLLGSVEEGLLRQMGLPADRTIAVPDALAGRVAVETALADGLALSSPTIQWMALNDQLGKTEMAQPFQQPELALRTRLGYGAFAFNKKDSQLQAAWNAALKTFIGSREHQQLIATFGFSASELPGEVTTMEVLSAR
jgi:polar amino acid transport system substrate-binding protein